MRTLKDKNTDLTFISYNKEDLKNQEELFNQINSWSNDENIKRYITNDTKVNDFLLNFHNLFYSDNASHLFYTFENNQPVGVIFLTDIDLNESIVEYIIVNPNIRGRGIGTRMIKSLTNHLEFFTDNKNISSLTTTIDKTNIASQKAFLKNNFYELKPAHSSQLSNSKFKHFRYIKTNTPEM